MATEKQQFKEYLAKLTDAEIQTFRQTLAKNAQDDVNYNVKYLRKLLRWVDD